VLNFLQIDFRKVDFGACFFCRLSLAFFMINHPTNLIRGRPVGPYVGCIRIPFERQGCDS
jgi:hypothetical protein